MMERKEITVLAYCFGYSYPVYRENGWTVGSRAVLVN